MTIRVSDEEFDLALKPDAKPTPKRQGHWQAVFWFHPALKVSLALPLGNDEWLDTATFPSEDLCEAISMRSAGEVNEHFALWVRGKVCRYVRAEYFPDYPSGGA